MNKIQFLLIELSVKKNIWGMSLREIGREINVKNAATVKYHLEQLKNKGLLKRPKTSSLSELRKKIVNSQNTLIDIPILGSANCGIAMIIAEEIVDGYLKVSPQLLPKSNYDYLFAIRAEGNSMNMAKINGNAVEEGDYLIIDSKRTNPNNGNYVLSIIDGCANIKKIIRDKERILLVSESTKKYPPIYIHPDDSYLINGTVVSVIKHTKNIN